MTPGEIVRAILDNPTDLAAVSERMAPDATYVSLNHDNPDLKRLMRGPGRAGTALGRWSRPIRASANIG